MEFFIGIGGGLAVCAFATAIGLDRDRAFYPVMLIVIAAYYLLFAAMGASPSALILDGLVMAAFVVVAVLGFKSSLWAVVAGLLVHGVMDLFHPRLIDNPGAPTWWPMFCLSFDVIAAGYLALRIWPSTRPSHAGRAQGLICASALTAVTAGAITTITCAVSSTPAFAQSAMRPVQFPDKTGQTIHAAIWTPTTPSPRPHPLVVISHGSVGSAIGHRDTAEALAKAGFIVAALEHPGDNYRDPSRTWRLTERPGHISALIDYLTQAWPTASTIDASRIGAFGFSAGGFTVASLAGGESDAHAIVRHCADHSEQLLCKLIGRDGIDPVNWRSAGYDKRIKAAVIAAPGFGFSFSDESLRRLRPSIQLWQAGNDEVLAAPYHVEPLRDRLSDVDYHLVPNALHHDFLATCDVSTSAAMPALCRSNEGFDRAAFKLEFNRVVVGFFVRELR